MFPTRASASNRPPKVNAMNAFVDPKLECPEVLPEFNKWFTEQLVLHWNNSFCKGFLALKLPSTCKFPPLNVKPALSYRGRSVNVRSPDH